MLFVLLGKFFTKFVFIVLFLMHKLFIKIGDYMKIVKRGFVLTDKKEFDEKSVKKLFDAAKDLHYLLNKNYNIKGSSVFVGNHYLLSERQRMALLRGVCSQNSIKLRKEKQVKNICENSIINIDGFNTIITLEVYLSASLILKSMDGSIRDLAGLRGTYRIIDKTEKAINLIGQFLQKSKIKKAVFYLDAPVSNSGKLKQFLLEKLSVFDFEVSALVINDVDRVLQELENVVTSDAIILDKCKSWINLNEDIIDFSQCMFVDFSNI